MGSAPPTVFRGWRRKYRVASRRIREALADKKYEAVADVGVRLAFVATPAKYSFSVVLAGVQAFQIGKDQAWRPSSEELAREGIEKAEKATEYRLSPSERRATEQLIRESLERFRKGKGETP